MPNKQRSTTKKKSKTFSTKRTRDTQKRADLISSMVNGFGTTTTAPDSPTNAHQITTLDSIESRRRGEESQLNPYSKDIDRFHNWSERPSPGHGYTILNGRNGVIASWLDKRAVDSILLHHNVDMRVMLRYLAHEVGKISREAERLIRTVEREYTKSI